MSFGRSVLNAGHLHGRLPDNILRLINQSINQFISQVKKLKVKKAKQVTGKSRYYHDRSLKNRRREKPPRETVRPLHVGNARTRSSISVRQSSHQNAKTDPAS